MKTLLLLLITLFSIVACGEDACARPAPGKTQSKQMSPFACDRSALDPAARKRHFDELGPQLRDAITGVRELPDGYEFRFSPDLATVAKVSEWAAGERLCCPFFEIQLRMDAEHGPLWLRLTGRKGTKAFIESDGAEWLKHPRVRG